MPDEPGTDPTIRTSASTGAEERTGTRDATLRLATVAAHQLRSPLSTIRTVIDTVVGGFAGPLEPRQRELLRRAAESAARGLQTVTELLNTRRLDDLSDTGLSPVDVRALLEKTVEKVRSAAASKGLRLATAPAQREGSPAWAMADAVLLEEALFVLLDNAVRYTPADGEVRIRLEEVSAEAPARLRVVVEDTGIGIPAGEVDQLFTEFFRASNARAAVAGGTGLGLAFARRAARRFGGDVNLVGRAEGGATATLELPVCAPGARPAAREPSRRVVVVGGVTAGSKCAARIRRLDPQAQVTVVERGKLLAYAGCGLPYYISGVVSDQLALVSSPLGPIRNSAYFQDLQGVTALEQTEAVAIDRTARTVTVRDRLSGAERRLGWDWLVLATGASAHAAAELPGASLDGVFTLHSMEDAEGIRRELRRGAGEDVVIVGAGLLGCEVTEALAMTGARVTLVEQQCEILGLVDPEIAAVARRHLERRGVKVVRGHRVVALGGEGRVDSVVTEDGRRLSCDMVVLAMGVRPEVRLAAAAGLELGPHGAIRVDASMRTSDPRIVAAGDCAEQQDLVTGRPTWLPMGSVALKQGRAAAATVCGLEDPFPGTLGSWIMKLFDLTVASTGLSEAAAAAAGFETCTALVPGLDRAHYLPNARRLLIKMVADAASGRLLGVQAVGDGEVAPRIFAAACALAEGVDIDRLAGFDLPYAPPYSLALDVVLTAANVLRNRRDRRVKAVSPARLQQRLASDRPPCLIDVRAPEEYDAIRLPGSRHLPLGSLRGRLHELDRDAEIVTVCSIGIRSYQAVRLLTAEGFGDVQMLDGGLLAWPFELEGV